MKILGMILTFLGGGGLIGTLVAMDSANYKVDRFAGYFNASQGYKTTVDVLFYMSIGILILGIVLLIVGYAKSGREAIACSNCQTKNKKDAKFCISCGKELYVRENIAVNPQFIQNNATAILVLGIVSIATCWFAFGIISITTGIIGLVKGNKAMALYQQTPDVYSQSSYKNIKKGRICSIIGLVMTVLLLIISLAISNRTSMDRF